MRIYIINFFFFLSFFCGIFFGVFDSEAGFKDPVSAEAASKQENVLIKYKDSQEISTRKVEKDRLERFIKEYGQRSDVEYVEPDHHYYASVIPNDTYFDKQWYLKKIGAPEAWDTKRNSPEKIIAIVDSGIQIDHPDLKGNIWTNEEESSNNTGKDDDNNGFIDDRHGWDFVNNDADPSPDFGGEHTESGILHGTLVSGVAAAVGNNGAGISGITWNAEIMPLKVLNDEGEGRTSHVVQAIDYAADNGADVINLSFVGLNSSHALKQSIDRAVEKGVIVVAAAGNEKDEGTGYDLDETPMYPVCYQGVIGVGATDTLDQKGDFSSFGLECIDISAPGVSMFGTSVYAPEEEIDNKKLDKYYDGYWAGTSMAAPIISGSLALIKSVDPSLRPKETEHILFETSDDINKLNPEYTGRLGAGRVNLSKAVQYAEEDLERRRPRIVSAPYSEYMGKVKVIDSDHNLRSEFLAYGENFTGGVNMAVGDAVGDDSMDIITGTGAGGGPHVRIFNKYGDLKSQFFAYDDRFRGGVRVASGDIDGDGIDEIITGAGAGGGPHVRVFDSAGALKKEFFAYHPDFRGGIYVASGDIDGDGIDEIITGAGAGGGPHVRVFDNKGDVVQQFFAYDDRFKGGVRVAAGNVDSNDIKYKEEIITAPGKGGGPHIKVFNGNSKLKSQFFAYNNDFRAGVQAGAGDIDKDGVDEIITGAGAGGAPHIRIFNSDGSLVNSLYGFDKDFTGGVNVDILPF
ncbi:MAG: S8 family peptidase [Patescibacteria group bacterium]